jgi:glycine cleavage system H protein
MTNIPSDLKYAKSHEWVRVSGDTATVGITDHAQHELTDIVFVELPDVGRKIKSGEACAVVESVKTASDIYSPLSGEVLEANKLAVDDPALVNSEPYAAGWFFKIKLSNPAELNALLSSDDYKKQIGGRRNEKASCNLDNFHGRCCCYFCNNLFCAFIFNTFLYLFKKRNCSQP